MSAISDQKIESISVTGLPQREGAVLCYTALGLSSKHIARKLDCSARNVENLRDSAKNRLQATNTPNLIAIAFQKGILRFLSLFLVIFGISSTLTPPLSAIDDDPLARRLRSHRTRRGSRRITRGLPQSAAINQLYIDCFGLEPVLAWDDGQMFVHYQPTTPFQAHPTAHVFNVDDLLRWHSDQFYQSFERPPGGSYGQPSEDQRSSQVTERETVSPSPNDEGSRCPEQQEST